MNIFLNKYIKCIIVLISLFFIFIVFFIKWLNVYTNHGQQVRVPNIKGFQVKEIVDIFKQKHLHYVVIDSIFIPENKPGSVLKTVPTIGTNVKPNRTIYLTISCHNPLLLTIPAIKNKHPKEVQSLLQSIGFKNIQTKTVCAPYKNLIIGLENDRGNQLHTGDRIIYNAPIFILISSGSIEERSSIDSTTIIDNKSEESWF